VSDDTEYAAYWWRLAMGDLSGARTLAADETVPARLAASLAQQATEKALKAVVALAGAEPPRTHDLVALAASLRGDRSILRRTNDLRRLTNLSMSSRYPEVSAPSFDPTEVRELIDIASSLIEELRLLLDRGGADTHSLDKA
jgi:HEPN domain-containing protein